MNHLSKIKLCHYGTCSSGKFSPDNPIAFRNDFSRFNGCEVQVTVEKKRKRRSNNQNAYYWGVVLPLIADSMGEESVNEAHDAMRMLFLLKRESKIPTLRSTSSLSTAEMEQYLSDIRMFAIKTFNCDIPLPNEVTV